MGTLLEGDTVVTSTKYNVKLRLALDPDKLTVKKILVRQAGNLQLDI